MIPPLSAARSPLNRIIASLCLIIIYLATLLAACQTAPNPTQRSTPITATVDKPSNGEQIGSTKSPAAPNRTPTPPPTAIPTSLIDVDTNDLKGTLVQYWHVWSGEPGRLTTSLVEEFNATNPWGIEVQATYAGSYDSLNEQVLHAIQEGETPDLVVAFDHQAFNWDAMDEITVDLLEYINDPVWGMSDEELDDFYPIFWQLDSDDKLIGMPAQRSGQLLFYNTSWAGELGFRSAPTTTAQFKAQSCAAARATLNDDIPENDSTGGWVISTDYSTVLGWLYAFGSPVVRPDGQGYRFNTPEVEDTLEFLRELYEGGCAWLFEDQSSEDAFASRRALFSTGSITSIPFQQEAFKRAGSEDDWTVIPFPGADGDLATPVYGPSYVVLETTPERQLASWLFTHWLLSSENQVRWVQTAASYPLQASTLDLLDSPAAAAPQWSAAIDLLEYAQPEPGLSSWGSVRWAVSDAATQLFRWYFTMEQLPDTVKLLDRTATELHNRSR